MQIGRFFLKLCARNCAATTENEPDECIFQFRSDLARSAKAVALDRNEVHVWQAALDQNESQIANYHRTLAADERARAERFHFSADRRRFVVARGALRAILGLYLIEHRNAYPSAIARTESPSWR